MGRYEEGIISDDLLTAMEEEADEYPVIIWTTDIDHNRVKEMVSLEFDYDWNTIEEDENDIIERAMERSGMRGAEEDGWSFVDDIYFEEMTELQEDSNNLILAERIHSKEEYLATNTGFAENAGITDKVFFMSGYAPMMFVTLSREVCRMCLLGDKGGKL